ncbi:MAG: hypothetical protein P4L87_15735 [Formivibrio sp.]|nr:hypothetical protein [Formivibrio sp.]
MQDINSLINIISILAFSMDNQGNLAPQLNQSGPQGGVVSLHRLVAEAATYEYGLLSLCGHITGGVAKVSLNCSQASHGI